jgi:hypothetical protein
LDEEEHSLFQFAAGKWFSTGIFRGFGGRQKGRHCPTLAIIGQIN